MILTGYVRYPSGKMSPAHDVWQCSWGTLLVPRGWLAGRIPTHSFTHEQLSKAIEDGEVVIE